MRRECQERFPCHRLQRKPLVSDPSMHYGTCVTHVPWCMSGSLNRGGGENVPGIPGACATRNFTYLARGLWHKTHVPPKRFKAAVSSTNRCKATCTFLFSGQTSHVLLESTFLRKSAINIYSPAQYYLPETRSRSPRHRCGFVYTRGSDDVLSTRRELADGRYVINKNCKARFRKKS